MTLSRLIVAAAACLLAAFPNTAPAQVTLVSPVFGGGGGFAAGADNQVLSIIGQPTAGLAQNEDFQLGAGLAYPVVAGQVANNPPLADAGEDQSVACTSHQGDGVTLDGSGSNDPDADALVFTWTDAEGTVLAGPSGEPTADVQLGTGAHVVTLTVNDERGGSDTDDVVIVVQDDTPPEATASLERISMNGEDEEDSDEDEGVFTVVCAAQDACDADPALLAVILLPDLENLNVSYKKSRTRKLEIKPRRNKVEIEGPDPTAFWSEIEQNAGIVVQNGGSIVVELKRGNDGYEYKFDLAGRLTAIEAPDVALRCRAEDASGNAAEAETSMIADGANKQAGVQSVTATPSAYKLDQNFPNPFNPTTTIRFHLPEPTDLRLQVYDLMGREIVTLARGSFEAGVHNATWDGKGADRTPVVSGVYILRIEAPSFMQTRLMILLK